MGGDGGKTSETVGGVGGGGNRGIHYFIKLTAVHGETSASSPSLSLRGKIKGLLSIPVLPLFL